MGPRTAKLSSFFLRVWSPLFIWIVLIFIGSLTKENRLDILRIPEGTDKLVHFFTFFILALLIGRTLLLKGKTFDCIVLGFWLVLVPFLYGLFIEFCQIFIATRSFSGLDILANLGGTATALFVYQWLK